MKENKKILMVAYTNYLTDARPRREAETLAARGDEVDFISLAEKCHPSEEVINGVRVLRLSMVRYRGAGGLKYVLSYLKFFNKASIKVVSLYIAKRYDVIHIHTMPDFLVFVAIVPKLLGARVILDVHDMMPELYMSKFGIKESHWFIKLIKLQEFVSTGFADRVICVHDLHKKVLLERHSSLKSLTVLLNVPDPNVFGELSQVKKINCMHPKFIYHGTISRRLGLDLALEAFDTVLQVLPDARFNIYGDGDCADEIEEYIRLLKISGSVYFSKEFFRVEEIPQLVNESTIGIIPNWQDQATEYMLPVKLLEYVYLGVPVAAPRLKTISYYFTEESIAFYEPGNVKQLADVLIMLSNDPDRCFHMAQHAQDCIRELSWLTIKGSLFKIVDN